MSGAEVDGTMTQGLCQHPGSISGLVAHTAIVTSEITSLLRPQFPHLQTRIWARQWEGLKTLCWSLHRLDKSPSAGADSLAGTVMN